MSHLPAHVDLTAYRGDTWSQTFRFKRDENPVDLSGATVEAEARSETGRVQLVAAVGTPAEGEVTISLPADVEAGVYDYDVEVTDEGFVQTWVKGRLAVNPDVTNEPTA